MSAFGILLLRPLSPICDMRQSFPLRVFAHFLSSKLEKVHGSNGCWWRLLYKGSAWGNYWRGVFKETSSETFAQNPDVFPCLSFSAFTLRMGSCWLYRVGWSSLRFIRCFARRTDGTHSGLLRISCLPLQPKTDVLGYVICARVQHLIPTIVHDHPRRNLGSGWSPCPSVPARKQGRLCWDTDGDDQSIWSRKPCQLILVISACEILYLEAYSHRQKLLNRCSAGHRRSIMSCLTAPRSPSCSNNLTMPSGNAQRNSRGQEILQIK